MKQENIINAIIEIGKGSNIKYEYDIKKQRFLVDRILYGANIYPLNYGFIENTLDYDGDPLDILILADQSFPLGVEVPVRILGAMEMIDAGDIDTKLIGVLACDPRYNHINNLEDIGTHRLDEIKNFFDTYKVLQKKEVKTGRFLNKEKAIKIINETKHLYKKYCVDQAIDKTELLKLLKQESK